jgi:hypothetical protein
MCAVWCLPGDGARFCVGSRGPTAGWMPAMAGDPGAGRDRRISAGLAREGCPVTARLTRRPGGPARLRALLDSSQTIVAPGAFDPLSARLVEEAGFPAVYMTG